MTGVAVPVTGVRTDRVRIAPLPEWVEHDAYEAPAAPDPRFIASGLCTLLNETQVDLCGPARAWHMRTAERVVTTAGAERAAQFAVTFNPSFEDLWIHYVRVIRDGVTHDHALPENFEIYRRERRLERLILDGRLTVSLITPDVRAGDLIESSYTIVGENPALAGLHTAWIAFEWHVPVLETRHRLRRPTNRVIHTKGFCQPPDETRTERDGVTDQRWRAYGRQPKEPVSLAPPWVPQNAEIQFSELNSWGDVAMLFAPLYETNTPLPDDLGNAVDALAKTHTDQHALAAEALRFVQFNIRYLAMGIGEGGYQPRALQTIWQTRYGDCKDVSRLLTAIGRRLGFDATPALVNTQTGEGLGESLPSPTAFDHCIVRWRLQGRTFWLDPTMRPQGGGLEILHQPYFGYALALTGPDAALEQMTAPKAVHVTAVEEDVELPKSLAEPALYRWTTTYADWKADGLRDELRNEGQTAIANRYLRQLRDLWPLADFLKPTEFIDDPVANRLTVKESYRLPSAWRGRDEAVVEFATKDFFIQNELVRMELHPRPQAIHIGRPRIITRVVRVQAPDVRPDGGWDRRLEGQALRYTSAMVANRRAGYTMTQRLEISADTMSGEAGALYADVTDAMARSDLVIQRPVRGDKIATRSGFWTALQRHQASIVTGVMIAAAGLWMAWRNGSLGHWLAQFQTP